MRTVQSQGVLTTHDEALSSISNTVRVYNNLEIGADLLDSLVITGFC